MSIDFKKYLEFICQDARFQDVQNFYTETEMLIPLESQTEEFEILGKNIVPAPLKKKIKPVSVLAGLRDYALKDQRQHLLLVGRPGLGKSTALKQLTLDLSDIESEQPDIVPVFLQLKSSKSISDLIVSEFRRAGVRVTPEQLDMLLFEGQLLLLLDGVNEIPSENQRHQVQEFREDNPITPMIFTTRDLTIGGDLGIKRRFEMCPLSEHQIKEFVSKYLTEKGLPGYVDVLLGQIDERLREIVEAPLLLKMFCDVFDPATQQVPQNKGELFRLFDAKYNEFKSVSVVSDDFRRFKPELLRRLAFSMICGKSAKSTDALLSVERRRAEEILETFLSGRIDAPAQRAKEWLEDLQNHYLVEITVNYREIEFYHQLFQEYYAAEELLSQLSKLINDENAFKQNYLNYLKWTEPIALMLSLIDNEADALRVVKLALEVDLKLGARLAGEAALDFQVATVGEIIALPIADRIKVELLGATRSEVATSELTSYLSHSDIHVVEVAASHIGKIHYQAAIDALIERLEETSERFFSQESWGDSDETGILWTTCVKALSYLSPELAIHFIREKLKDYESLLLIITDVVPIFMKLSPETIIPELLQKFQDAQEEENKKLAATVNVISQTRAHPPSSESLKRNHILNLLDNSSDYELFIPKLVQLFETESDEFVQKQIIQILGKSKQNNAIYSLIQKLDKSSSIVRSEAARQLTKLSSLDNTENIKALRELVNHPNWEISWCAAIVLGTIKDLTALPRMIYELENHANPSIRSTAAKVIGIAGDQSCVPSLVNAIDSESNRYVRIHVACALSHFEAEEAIPVLLDALKTVTNADPHAEVIKGLSRFGLKDVLLEIIKSKRLYWQRAAIELGKSAKTQKGDELDVLPDLFNALVDRGLETSNETIDILSELADSKTLERLIEALKYPERHKSDIYFPNRIALVLVRCRPEMISVHLSTLKGLNRSRDISQLSWLIPTIQGRCKFYDYEIWKATPKNEMGANSAGLMTQKLSATVLARIDQTTQKTDQQVEKMAKEPRTEKTINIANSSINAPVGTSGITNSTVTQPDSNPQKGSSWGNIVAVIGIFLTIVAIGVNGVFNEEVKQWLHRTIPSQVK